MIQWNLFFSFLILIAMMMVILSLNAMHALVWLVIVFITSALYLLSLNYPFLGLMILIVYAGAIAILFLFVIMMLDVLHLTNKPSWMPMLMFTSILVSWISTIHPWKHHTISTLSTNWNYYSHSKIQLLSLQLYGPYMNWFIMVSLLLLVAMVGAIILTLTTNPYTKHQHLSQQHQRPWLN